MQESYRSKYFLKSLTNENNEQTKNIPKAHNLNEYYLNKSKETRYPRKISKEINYTKTSGDVFSIYGYTRLMKSSNMSDTSNVITYSETVEKNEKSNPYARVIKEKDLHVKFYDESANERIDSTNESQNINNIKTMESKESQNTKSEPIKDNLFDEFSNLFSDINERNEIKFSKESSEQEVPKYVGQNESYSEKKTNIDDSNKEKLIHQINHLEEKIKFYNKKLSILKAQLSENNNIEVDNSRNNETEFEEFEEYQETTTRKIPLYSETAKNNFDDKLEEKRSVIYFNNLFHYDSLPKEMEEPLSWNEINNEENEVINNRIVLMENESNNITKVIKVDKKYNICSDVDLLEYVDINDHDSFEEWIDNNDHTYSIEQRNIMENLYFSFQTNRTEFVKSIISLLAKNVKSVAIQAEYVLCKDMFTNTNKIQNKTVYCGETDTVNVSVVDWSKMKHVSVQINPQMMNKFTIPMTIQNSENSSSTKDLIKTCSKDFDYRIHVKSVSTQTAKNEITSLEGKNHILEKEKYVTNRNSYHEGLNPYNGNIDNGSTQKSYQSLLSNPVKQYFSTKYQNYVNSLRRPITPKFKDKSSSITKFERSGCYSSGNKTLFNSYNRKRNNYSSMGTFGSYRQRYRSPGLYPRSNDNHLTQFNDFMRDTILQGYVVPVPGKMEKSLNNQRLITDSSELISHSNLLKDGESPF